MCRPGLDRDLDDSECEFITCKPASALSDEAI